MIDSFDAKSLMAHFKFDMTLYTLNIYTDNSDSLAAYKICQKDKCMPILDQAIQSCEIGRFKTCIKDCQFGADKVIEMQREHAEVARLTYAKNIARCMQIHADGAQTKSALTEDNPAIKWTDLAHCIQHNTDKVDRRFFGYYSNEKQRLLNKFQH